MTEITSRLKTALADRYKLRRHLGEGGMATVYLAEDLKHHRKVAVKVLRSELAALIGPERSKSRPTCSIRISCRCSIPATRTGFSFT
jgi:hypothetical protein